MHSQLKYPAGLVGFAIYVFICLRWLVGPVDRKGTPATVHWFGKPTLSDYSSVGPRVLQKKPRVLMVSVYRDYLDRMDRAQYDMIDAALRDDSISVEVWGPGWVGFDATKSFTSNVEDRYGCGHFDIIYWMWPVDLMTGPSFGCGTILATEIGDCHGENTCINSLFHDYTNITMTRYSFELVDHFNYNRLTTILGNTVNMQLFAHVPECANPEEFYPRAAGVEATKVATLMGSSWIFYPIRTTIQLALDKENRTTISRQDHPGYSVTVDPRLYKEARVQVYGPNEPATATHRKISRTFAEAMRDSKICVFDSSLEKKMIRKYVQAMLSGCVIASDLPSELEDVLRDVIIHLDPTWTIEQINEALESALLDPVELERKARKAYLYAIDNLVCSKRVIQIVDLAHTYARGVRGYTWPYGFSAVCRQYHPDETDGFYPPWCTPNTLQNPQSYPDTL